MFGEEAGRGGGRFRQKGSAGTGVRGRKGVGEGRGEKKEEG